MRKFSFLVLSILMFLQNRASADDAVSIDTFKLTDLQMNSFAFPSDLKTDKIVINFFASWCTTCEEEVPLLKKLSDAHPEATFYGINAGENEKKASRFVIRANYPWKVLLDPDKAIAKRLSVLGIPTTLVLNKQGKVLFRGSRPPEKL